MSDEKDVKTGDGEKLENANADGGQHSEKSQDGKTVDSVPYARFKEVNDAMKELKQYKEAKEKQEAEAEEKRKLEEKTLADQIASLKEKQQALASELDEYKAQEKKERDDLLTQIEGEDEKEVASELSLPSLRKFIAKLKSQESGGGSQERHKRAGAGEDKNPYKRQGNETYNQYQQRIRSLK